MKYWKQALICICILLAVCIGCQPKQTDSETQYIIGVAAYDPDNAEMRMFMDYYRDYIAEGFPVKFYFSGRLTSAEEEQAFIRSMKQQGAHGIISFFGNDIQPVLQTCAEEQMYYILGSGTLDEADFQAVQGNPYFLGTIGPAPETEINAGADMAAHFKALGAKRLLILSGGAAQSNYMHLARAEGMLEALGVPQANTLAGTAKTQSVQADGLEITIAPGYYSRESDQPQIDAALAAGDYDAVLCTYNIDILLPAIQQREAQLGHSIRAGTVDCFSAQNLDIIRQRDQFGNPQIDYIEGKYASMAGPAFAAMYNALHGDMEVIRPSGQAFRLYQGFWTAKSPEEYIELYGYTIGMYENAYSCTDLMQVIRAFRKDASFDKLKALTEAYDVQAVIDRMQ